MVAVAVDTLQPVVAQVAIALALLRHPLVVGLLLLVVAVQAQQVTVAQVVLMAEQVAIPVYLA